MSLCSPSGFSSKLQLHLFPVLGTQGQASCRGDSCSVVLVMCQAAQGKYRYHGTVLQIHNTLPLALQKRKSKNAFAGVDYSELVFSLVKLYCNVDSLGRYRIPQPSHPDSQSSESLLVTPSLCEENLCRFTV